MGDKYIEKEDAIQSIIAHDLVGGNARGWAEYLLENTSTADVAPVRHGRFVPFEDVFMDTCWECSECGLKFYLVDGGTPKENSYNYCPNCGARMDGEDNEID